MPISSMDELYAYLKRVQESRERDVRCELSARLSAQLNDNAIATALVTGLPLAQGIRPRILRSRGRGILLTAQLTYRQGVRMLEARQAGGNLLLDASEQAGLAAATEIAAAAMQIDQEEARFSYLYAWICGHVRYAHTAPGRKGYERLVGAADVLADGRANCQGFADLLYLLCGLCGIECSVCCGWGKRQLHVWNTVRLQGEWREIDASKGAREQSLAQGCGAD
ncbi:MAG: hypothetical protein IJB81_09850 [Clostridia bacterium]|nr:hypothetical protein [Clostridia bacterium]